MKNNSVYHQQADGNNFFESELENAHMINVHGKRIHKPISSGDMWFIQKNYKRRSIGDQVNYRF